MSDTEFHSQGMGTTPAEVSAGQEFVRMLRDQPEFLAGVMGGRLGAEGPYPPVADVDVSPDGPHRVHGAMNVVPLSYKEDRGTFLAQYSIFPPNLGFASDVSVKGFLVGDQAVIDNVVSMTDSKTSPVPGADVIRFDARVEDGVATDTTTVSNPTKRTSIDIAMAGGRFYDVSKGDAKLLDASSMHPAKVDELRESISESFAGVVWVAVDVAPSIGDGRRIADPEVFDDVGYDGSSPEVESMRSIRERAKGFRQDIADRFARDSVPMLAETSAAFLREDRVHVVPVVEGSDLKVVDGGSFATVTMTVPQDARGDGELRPSEVSAFYDVVPGRDPVLKSFELKAETFERIDGSLVKTHDSSSSVHNGEAAHVEDRRPTTQVVLAAEGGRLYAVQDNHYGERKGLAEDDVRVSEVRGGLDGVALYDLLKNVTSQDGVRDWTVPVLGEVGAGPVSLGGVDVADSTSVTAGRLFAVDGAVGAFRRENGHDRGIMAQAGGVKREGDAVASKGPEASSAPGIIDRMKAALSGRDGGR